MRRVTGFLCLLALFFAGCGGDSIELVEVTGTVTVDGKLVSVGSIDFVPDATKDNKGPLASAQIGADGKFTLMTGTKNGAIAGFHKIVVKCPFNPSGGSSGSGKATADASGSKCNIHLRYGAANTTPLSEEVKAGSANTFEIKLQANPK